MCEPYNYEMLQQLELNASAVKRLHIFYSSNKSQFSTVQICFVLVKQ